MISKRYYLTFIGFVPIFSAHVFLALWTLKRARSRRGLFRLWKAGVTGGAALVFLDLLGEFQLQVLLSPILAAASRIFFVLCGPIGASALGILLLSRFVGRRVPIRFRRDRRLALRMIAGMSVAAPLGVAGFGAFVERTNFEVSETPVGIRNLPKGDPLDACLAQLSRLKASAPKLGCLGNHEVYADAVSHTVRQGARKGIEFLRSRAKSVKIGDAVLNIAGVDYEPFGQRLNYLRNASSMIVPGAVNVLLSHNPDVFPVAAAQGYDLTLSGHTHGSQVTFEILSPSLNPARMLTPFVRGLYRKGDHACYVTRGIGTLGVPARFGARPEITLLTLRRI